MHLVAVLDRLGFLERDYLVDLEQLVLARALFKIREAGVRPGWDFNGQGFSPGG